ncbi:AAA family ATPase [Trueperella pyogenes]|uniref:AAA family ATPase n=1 Tax=Trueperella pyogenes TaxID=1661 RepID=UPI00345C98EA
MSKVWIRQIKAVKDDGTASVIDLTSGLNVIVGPSNTGKTRIVRTVAYACGSDQLPFTDKTGYTTAVVTFVTPNGEVTLSRSTKPRQGVVVESTDPNVESRTYSLTRSAKRPINDLLLSLIDIAPDRKVITNETFKKASFTWDSVKHLVLVPESEIGRPEPSILFPKSNNPMTLTQNLSSLLVLAQDENLDDAQQRESAAERSARRRAVERFIYGQLDQIQTRLAELEEAESQAKAEGKTLQFYMAELRETLEQLENQRREIIIEDEACVKRISDLNQTAQTLEVSVGQLHTLLTQYEADLGRLDLRLQSLRHDHETPQPDTCQFCHSKIDAPEVSAHTIEAHEQEIARIQALRAGALADLHALTDSYDETRADLSAENQRHLINMSKLKRELEPATEAIQTRLNQLATFEKVRAEHAELIKLKARFDKELEGTDDPPDREEKFKPRERFHREFYLGIEGTIRTILNRSHFEGADLADFNRQTFDIDIDCYSKVDEQGKGYSAFFNTVLMLAFHEYLNSQSPHAPGHLVIDTPLHGFDEGNRTPDNSMRAGLFDHLAQQAKDQQIIIIENTDHMQGFALDEAAHQISFTKNRDQGRYGYLAGVYDVGEGTE